MSIQLTHPGVELRNKEDGGIGLYDSELIRILQEFVRKDFQTGETVYV